MGKIRPHRTWDTLSAGSIRRKRSASFLNVPNAIVTALRSDQRQAITRVCFPFPQGDGDILIEGTVQLVHQCADAVEGDEHHRHGRRDHRHHRDADHRDDVHRVGTPFGQEVAAGEEEGEVHGIIAGRRDGSDHASRCASE